MVIYARHTFFRDEVRFHPPIDLKFVCHFVTVRIENNKYENCKTLYAFSYLTVLISKPLQVFSHRIEPVCQLLLLS